MIQKKLVNLLIINLHYKMGLLTITKIILYILLKKLVKA